jgi:hypothetical protein
MDANHFTLVPHFTVIKALSDWMEKAEKNLTSYKKGKHTPVTTV